MSYFDQKSLSVVGHYIAPSVDVEGTNSIPGTLVSENADARDVVPNAFVPGVFYISPYSDQIAFGFVVTTHFGLSSEFPDDYAASEHSDETMLKAVYLTPSISYKVNEKVSLGLGISYITGEGKLKTSASNTSATAVNGALMSPALAQGDTMLDLESEGDGFGWNVGLMWQIDEAARLGVRYMAASDIDTDADYKIFSTQVYAASGGTEKYADLKGTLTLNVPEVIEIAYSRQLDDKLMIAASIQRTGWSSFEEIKVDDTVLKEEDWEDVNRYSFGADYKLNDTTVLRAGYALDESPVPNDKRTLSIPDTDRKVLSVGGTLGLPTGTLDLGLAYIKGESVSFTEESSSGTTFEGKLSSSDALIFSAGYNVSF
jgi:long-chain fatty acid transport protein